MVVKLKTSKKAIRIAMVLLILVISLLAYRRYQYDAFKRAYKHGTVYEQLIVLTGYGQWFGGKRYVKPIRQAGYEIDEYNLRMNGYISSLTTKELGIEIVPLSNRIDVRYNYTFKNQSLEIGQIFNDKMEQQRNGIYYKLDEFGFDKKRIDLSKEEREQLREVTLTEIKAMLKDIYDSMYPDES